MKLATAILAALAVTQVSSDFVLDMRRTAATYVDAIGNLAQQMDVIHSTNLTENIVFSPLCMGSALLTLLAASDGKAHEEIKKLFGFDKLGFNTDYHDEAVHRVLGYLQTHSGMAVEKDFPITSDATGVFVNNKFPINETFKRIIQKAYKSDVFNVDFSDTERTRNTINKWVSELTRGKIPQMLDIVSPYTEVIIASALYFSGAWEYPFLAGVTRREKFFIEKGNSVDADMMYNGGVFPYYYDKELGAHIIALPYKGTRNFNVSMYMVQPEDENTGAQALDILKRRMHISIVERMIEKMVPQSCIVGMPKMKLSSKMNLQTGLIKLGLGSLFNTKDASFEYLSSGDKSAKLVISSFIHNVEMTIDEKGTEAAATTNVIMNKSGHTRFVANRPFTFFIRDNTSKLILFWGSINKPTLSN